MQIWLTILVSWPEPGGSDQGDGTGIGLDHGLGFAEIHFVAADHDRERAALRTGLAA